MKNVDDASSNHKGEKKQLTQPKPNEVNFGVTPNQMSLDTWRSTARSNTDTKKDESKTKIQKIHKHSEYGAIKMLPIMSHTAKKQPLHLMKYSASTKKLNRREVIGSVEEFYQT